MSNTAPVENEHSAEASQHDQRRDFVDLPEPPHRNFRHHVGDVLLGRLLQHLGLDHGRRDAVDAHARGRKLLAERLGERDHAGLRGGIGAGVRIALLAGDRGDVDDAPVAALLHARHHRAAGEERTGQVHVHHGTPFVERILRDRRVDAADRRAVDQDIDRADAALGLGKRARDGVRVADIGRDQSCARSLGLAPLLEARAVPHGDARAGLRHALHDCQANAARAAGDNGDFAGEVDLIHAADNLVRTRSSRRPQISLPATADRPRASVRGHRIGSCRADCGPARIRARSSAPARSRDLQRRVRHTAS